MDRDDPPSSKRHNITKDSFNRKIVRPGLPTFRVKPHIGRILADAHSIISEELRSLRERVENGEYLSREDVSRFKIYADAFTKLAQTEREEEKKQDPATIGDTELAELALKAAKVLGAEEIEGEEPNE